MAIKYKDILPIGNALIIAGTFFFLGLLLGNWPYDTKTLFTQQPTAEAFENSLKHYQIWAEIPRIPLHIIHSILGLGFIGLFIKLYRPSDDSKYFEYGSLFLYVIAFCVYLTNLKTGVESALSGEWGEVDQNTGINVIAASQAMIVFLLGGVIALQGGLYYGEWDYQQRLEAFNEEEAKLAAEGKSTPVAASTSTTAAPAPVPASTPVAKKEPAAKATPAKKPTTSAPSSSSSSSSSSTKQTARKRRS